MFGYVKIHKPELLVKDYETYRAVYCGLCKTMGRRYSVFSRLSLNYDYTLYALLGLSLQKEEPSFKKQGCLFNPCCRKMCCLRDGALEKAADALIIGTWFKLSDDVSDSGFFKKISYRFLRLSYRPMAKKAQKTAPAMWQRAKAYIEEQRKTETQEGVSPDEAAEPTARYLADLFAELSPKEEQRRVLSYLGYNLGKWIYWTDAADDLLDDLKKGRFNPWIDYNCLSETDSEADVKTARQSLGPLLNTCVDEAAKALDLLSVNRYEMILKNIVYLGLPKEQLRILQGKPSHSRRKKEDQ